jgi:hypothetical protein
MKSTQVIKHVNTTEKCQQNSVLSIASKKNSGGLDRSNMILDKLKPIINIRISTIPQRFIYIFKRFDTGSL